MYLIPYFSVFPEEAARETRVITILDQGTLPADEYALIEFYCPDPVCHCRRVMLNVLASGQMERGHLASISFGFDRSDADAGPFLDPLNPQSEYAAGLFDLVVELVLSQPAYVSRLENHYARLKHVASDPTHPQHGRLQAALGNSPGEPPAQRRPRKKSSVRRRRPRF